MRIEQKQKLAQRRHWRIRKKLSGTKNRPRMSVCFTNKNIHVQFIDDDAGVTLVAASTTSKAAPDRDKLAATPPAPKPWAFSLRKRRWVKASKKSFSTGAARAITARSKPWRMLRVKQA